MKITAFVPANDKGIGKVVSGVFAFVGTHGVPLEAILDRFKQNNIIIDWMAYIVDALKDGHNPNTIRSRILEAVGDVYGPLYKKEINKRLDILFNDN